MIREIIGIKHKYQDKYKDSWIKNNDRDTDKKNKDKEIRRIKVKEIRKIELRDKGRERSR